MSELQSLQQQHREEVAAFKSKLQWFAENQELLDRDAGQLKAATAEIVQLKEQVGIFPYAACLRNEHQTVEGFCL